MPGLVRVNVTSATDSSSANQATAECPAQKVLVGTGYGVDGATDGEVVVDDFRPNASATTVPTSALTRAFEVDPGFTGDWQVTSYAICATP